MPAAPVTVVLTCFNHEAYIAEAVGSVLAQTRRPARVVVVDDGSRDRSAEVIRGFAAEGVELIAQPNAGVCLARNRGAEPADTPFLMFLDGDDWLAPTYVERTLGALCARPRAAFAYTPFVWFGGRTGVHPSLPYRADLLAAGNYIHNAALMRTGAFRSAGGFDPAWNRRGWEDWDLWLRFAARRLRGVLVDEPLLHVRAHAGSHRNRSAEADRTLAADLLSRHAELVPRSRAAFWLAKLWRRTWLAARGAGFA
jgi:glycosyltransferase involved in cell wall biosynthesis